MIPVLGRSLGEENGNSLPYSCLGNPMDRGAWWATICGVGSQRVGHDLATKQQQPYSRVCYYLLGCPFPDPRPWPGQLGFSCLPSLQRPLAG